MMMHSMEVWVRSQVCCLSIRPHASVRRRACRTWDPPTWRAAAQSQSPRASPTFCSGPAKTSAKSAPFIRKWPTDFCPDSRHVCRGIGQGSSSGEAFPEEEDSDKVLDSTPPILEGSTSSSGGNTAENTGEEDWRAFRARLVAGEQSESTILQPDDQEKGRQGSTAGILGKKWAHPIHVPETGCLLVATEKLDGQVPFERSVILLLRLGSNKPRDGPFGIILNRPILHTTNESEPITEAMAQMLQNCRLFYGGPLASDIFLLMREAEGHDALEEIMPGVYYGYADGLQQAAEFAKDDSILHDFRFFVGYAGWNLDQLKDEIAEGLWCVAACSPDLIRGASSDSLWQEVLMSMGGDYAELSKKSKGDGV